MVNAEAGVIGAEVAARGDAGSVISGVVREREREREGAHRPSARGGG